MRIATWNINSVRLRIAHVLRFVEEYDIDVICLQETKTEDKFFPINEFIKIGMKHYSFRGEKSYNGVAILSKIPIKNKNFKLWCDYKDTRHNCVILDNNIKIHNFYVPAGGDVPDVKLNVKFDHKINFLKEMIKYFNQVKLKRTILVGDLNIAPFEHDVWSHKQLLNVVSHTPMETELLIKIMKDSDWIDVGRKFFPKDEKLYSWWSYRNKYWKKSNRGRRLDHIWVSKDLDVILKSFLSCKEIRDWEKPSDHVPLILELSI